jgi:eukaryotic translation initiation factor 2C
MVGKIVFDGKKSMYAASPLPGFSSTEHKEFLIVHKEADQSGRERDFKIRIREVARVNMMQLSEYINGRSVSYIPYDAIQCLDVLLRHRAAKTLSTVGRSLYSPAKSSNLGDGVQAWTGYYQSIRPAFSQLLLNVE